MLSPGFCFAFSDIQSSTSSPAARGFSRAARSRIGDGLSEACLIQFLGQLERAHEEYWCALESKRLRLGVVSTEESLDFVAVPGEVGVETDDVDPGLKGLQTHVKITTVLYERKP